MEKIEVTACIHVGAVRKFEQYYVYNRESMAITEGAGTVEAAIHAVEILNTYEKRNNRPMVYAYAHKNDVTVLPIPKDTGV